MTAGSPRHYPLRLARYLDKRLRRRLRHGIALPIALALATLTGCATSSFTVGLLYDRLDNRIVNNIKNYVELDARQATLLEARVQDWQDWHRDTQLPAYGAFVREVGTRIAEDSDISRAEVDLWVDTLSQLYGTVADCHPLLGVSDLLASFSDDQVRQLADGLAERERKAAEPKSEEERLRDTLSGLRRVGFTINAEEQGIVRDHLANSIDMQPLRRDAVATWNRELLDLLADRQSPDFAQRVESHLSKALVLTRSAYPEESTRNLEDWAMLIHQLLDSQPGSGRRRLAKRLGDLGDSLVAVANGPGKATKVSSSRSCPSRG